MSNIVTGNLGDHLVMGVLGTRLDRSEKELLRRLSPLGIMLLDRNFLKCGYQEWIDELRVLLDDIHEATGRERMLITIDHEGGRWMRAPVPITKFPAAINYRDNARRIGEAKAIELMSIGCNLTFAPVLDINSNPQNPVIGDRAFGNNREDVCLYAEQYIEGIQRQGLLTCGKHFPGHGDTGSDSHYELPVVDKSLSELYENELYPFFKLASRVDSLMTAHIVYPQIDTMPATISEVFLQEVCRRKIGFDGLIFSDDLEMKAILPYIESGHFRRALASSVDMFIISRYWGVDVITDLERDYAQLFIEGNELSSTIDISNQRINSKLANLTRFEPLCLGKDQLREHFELALSTVYG